MTAGPATESTPTRGATRLCIVTPYESTLTETFIRAHVERLPADVMLVEGWRPKVCGRTVLSRPRIALYKAARMLLGEGGAREMTAAYVRAFRRHRAEAVLVEYGDTAVHVFEACRRARLPLVAHFHGYDASEHETLRKNAAAYPRMFEAAAAVIAVSHAMRRRLVSLGAPPEKVHVNHYGVDCEEFGGGDPAAAPPTFVAVGRFTPKKAPQLTLKAFAEARRACPGARLRMLGEGPLLAECRALAAELKIEDAVEFLGARPHAAVREEVRRARAFVQHSVVAESGDSEGTPVAIIEAGATGLPVVSTRHAGIPDVVVEGETGFLVEEGDVEGMAGHMARLALDAGLAASMGRAARRRVETHFTMERSLGNLWAIIESCIARRPAAARQAAEGVTV
jgi:colanic acid/amylovoran biosynthesis glycosyltransferase